MADPEKTYYIDQISSGSEASVGNQDNGRDQELFLGTDNVLSSLKDEPHDIQLLEIREDSIDNNGQGDISQLSKEEANKRVAALTPRELAMIALSAQGQEREDIADMFTLAPSTVAQSIYKICAKLGVNGYLHSAVAIAVRAGKLDHIPPPQVPQNLREILSNREYEVLYHAATGLNDTQIAKKLSIKRVSVNRYSDQARGKLNGIKKTQVPLLMSLLEREVRENAERTDEDIVTPTNNTKGTSSEMKPRIRDNRTRGATHRKKGLPNAPVTETVYTSQRKKRPDTATEHIVFEQHAWLSGHAQRNVLDFAQEYPGYASLYHAIGIREGKVGGLTPEEIKEITPREAVSTESLYLTGAAIAQREITKRGNVTVADLNPEQIGRTIILLQDHDIRQAIAQEFSQIERALAVYQIQPEEIASFPAHIQEWIHFIDVISNAYAEGVSVLGYSVKDKLPSSFFTGAYLHYYLNVRMPELERDHLYPESYLKESEEEEASEIEYLQQDEPELESFTISTDSRICDLFAAGEVSLDELKMFDLLAKHSKEEQIFTFWQPNREEMHIALAQMLHNGIGVLATTLTQNRRDIPDGAQRPILLVTTDSLATLINLLNAKFAGDTQMENFAEMIEECCEEEAFASFSFNFRMKNGEIVRYTIIASDTDQRRNKFIRQTDIDELIKMWQQTFSYLPQRILPTERITNSD